MNDPIFQRNEEERKLFDKLKKEAEEKNLEIIRFLNSIEKTEAELERKVFDNSNKIMTLNDFMGDFIDGNSLSKF